MASITFVKGKGGLGRSASGTDHISGAVFYSGAYPSGFDSSNKVKKITSLQAAEDLGIVDTHSDETAATGTYQVTAIGSNGDTVKLTVTEPTKTGGTTSVTLCTYTKAASETTVNEVAAAIEALIDADSFVHGYSASVSTDTVTITARPKLGVALNTGTPIVATETGTIAGTVTQFSSGAASKLANMHYHIDQFFKKNSQGILYTGVFPVPGSYTFTELQDVQNFANGEVKQAFIYNDAARSKTEIKSDTTAIQTVVETLESVNKRVDSVTYAPNIKAISDVAVLETLGSLTNENVSITIGQDAGGTGAELYMTSGVSITDAGATVGTISKAKVSENIGWVQEYDFSDGTEYETIGFSNGQAWEDVSDSLKTQLDTYRYQYLQKHLGIAGSYKNDSHTCIVKTSDYAYIENNRTIGKAIRNARTALLPKLNSPLLVNSNGTMTLATREGFSNALQPDLDQMVRDEELSSYGVLIDDTQNVVSTSEVVVTLELQPVGVARAIKVNIGFVARLTTTA